MKKQQKWFISITLAVGLFAVGCASTKPVVQVDDSAAKTVEAARLKAEADAKAKVAADAAAREARLKAEADAAARAKADAEAAALAARQLVPVYFDYDDYSIRADQQGSLSGYADKLNMASSIKLTLAGHCDERGTVEYNLALGQKRADAVKNYLVRGGVDAERLGTVSFGKEKPVDPGHNEASWAKNRRVEFSAQ
ncbi:MAG: peptidoglycan-associated lipoprotein Pal [Candidatus Latescibacterota bacterium]|jgi:peptidoglycan-associated lipoprotein